MKQKAVPSLRCFNFKPLLPAKIQILYALYNFLQWKSHLKERNMHRSSTVYKWKQSKTVLNKYVGGFWCERTTVKGLFLEEAFLWIIDSYFGQKQCFKLICLNDGCVFLKTHSFLPHKTLIVGLDYWDVFISCLDLHSDGTHSLQKIHWWANDVMLNFLKSVPMRKQTHLHLGFFSKFSFLVNLF